MTEIEIGTWNGGGFLQDDSGNSSSTRLVTFLWFLGLIVAFVIATLRSTAVPGGGIPDIPWGVITLSAAVLGGKQVGKWIEMLQAIQALKEKCSGGGGGVGGADSAGKGGQS